MLSVSSVSGALAAVETTETTGPVTFGLKSLPSAVAPHPQGSLVLALQVGFSEPSLRSGAWRSRGRRPTRRRPPATSRTSWLRRVSPEAWKIAGTDRCHLHRPGPGARQSYEEVRAPSGSVRRTVRKCMRCTRARNALPVSRRGPSKLSFVWLCPRTGSAKGVFAPPRRGVVYSRTRHVLELARGLRGPVRTSERRSRTSEPAP